MKATLDIAARHAWRGAFVAAALNTIAMPADYALGRSLPGMSPYPPLISAGVGAMLLVILLIRRPHATVRLGSVVFLLNNAAILFALWMTSSSWALAPAWTPFQANKLGALAAALLAPTLPVGLISIGGFAGMAIAKFFTFAPEIQNRLPVGEPWFILFYALFGAALLWYRLRSQAFEREVMRAHAETAAAEQVAHTVLQLRDYANTPIQTIVFAIELMRVRHPDLSPVLNRLERATRRLAKLSHAFRRYEATHKWKPGDESPSAPVIAQAASEKHARLRIRA